MVETKRVDDKDGKARDEGNNQASRYHAIYPEKRVGQECQNQHAQHIEKPGGARETVNPRDEAIDPAGREGEICALNDRFLYRLRHGCSKRPG